MAIPSSTTQISDSLEQYDDVVSWINDTLTPADSDDCTVLPYIADLTELDHQITQLLTTLDIASEDTSVQLERIVDDVSRGIPRLAYDLHFMKDGASTLQNALLAVLQRSKDAVPKETSDALDNLHRLDAIKGRMEAARDVLREAESWSTLEHEVTSLILEKSYAKAAERLSEANKSMIVFQNTPEYDPRRALMVNLQNQLEAALSTALVSAINAQDSASCREYFSIFSIIQRESEFRNYYYGSRRSNIISTWQNASLTDCDGPRSITVGPSQSFAEFLPTFYSNFVTVLNSERSTMSSIFPDPMAALSQFITSTISSLQPTIPQRLSSYSTHHGDAALIHLIVTLGAAEEFAANIQNMMEKMKYTSSPTTTAKQLAVVNEKPVAHRRRSSRMSISLRSTHRTTSTTSSNQAGLEIDSMEWDQEIFQPFLNFQIDYGSLERRFLDHSLSKIIASDVREKVSPSDRPRLFRERAIDLFGIADGSMARCKSFTYGYGSVGLVQALDGFFQSFIDTWTADVLSELTDPASSVKMPATENDLSDLDYTAQDWSNIQLSLHLLASAKTVFDRLSGFETKLRAYLIQVASQFRTSLNDPINFPIAPSKGESQMLEQSTLNSAELHALLSNVENDINIREPPFSASVRLQAPAPPLTPDPLLSDARKALLAFAETCQSSTTRTILSPLRNHLTGYPSLLAWRSLTDANSMTSTNDLRVPTFSLSQTETIQKVAEGLLNLPRLFEVYADDDALAFSLETLPHVGSDTLHTLTEYNHDIPSQQSHRRRSSVFVKPRTVDPEVVSSAWLLSLGHTFLEYFTSDVLTAIPSLSVSGAAQLSSDLEYLSNIVRALNVEHDGLEKWKTYISIDADEGRRILSESASDPADPILNRVAKLRGWR